MSTLPARAAYRLWAPSYAGETVVSALDDLLVAKLSPRTRGRRLLDAGCGTGRRLDAVTDAQLRTGVDLVPEMLAHGFHAAAAFAPSLATTALGGAPARRPRERRVRHLAAADVRALPFAAASFDLVWCRLVLGHLPSLEDAYAELARVCRPRGAVVVSDFHPAAAAAGHARTFRAADGALHAVEHHVHDAAAHHAAAARAGLEPAGRRDAAVGPAVRHLYAQAGKLDRYDADHGLPLVLGLVYRRRGAVERDGAPPERRPSVP